MLSICRPALARAFSTSASRAAMTSNEVLDKAVHTIDNLSGGQSIIQDLHPSASVQPTLTQAPIDTAELYIPPAEDPLLTYFASHVMEHGKRQRANRIISRTLLHIHAFTRAPPLPIFRQAVFNASPAVRVQYFRQSAKNVLVPKALSERKRTWFGVRWLLEGSMGQPGRTLEERLAREMIAAVNGGSNALRKKEEVHKMAMVNRGNLGKRMGGRR